MKFMKELGQWKKILSRTDEIDRSEKRDTKPGNRYVGQMRNNKENGFGIYFYQNGDKYEGEWMNGKKHGTGLF
jgi:hypothetical protein